MESIAVGVTCHGDFSHTFTIPMFGVSIEERGTYDPEHTLLKDKLRRYIGLFHPDGLTACDIQSTDCTRCDAFVDEWLSVPIEEIYIDQTSPQPKL